MKKEMIKKQKRDFKTIAQIKVSLLLFFILALNLSLASALYANISTYHNVTDVYHDFMWDKSNIQFQVRSCDDALCSGEVFVGPDNTTSSWLSNFSWNQLNSTLTPNNRYFQYKAFLWRNISGRVNESFTPRLYNVSIGIYNYSSPYIKTPVMEFISNALNCTTTGYSLNGNLNISFLFYKNNSLAYETTVNTSSGSSTSFSLNYLSSYLLNYPGITAVNQWYCKVRAYDGNYSDNATSYTSSLNYTYTYYAVNDVYHYFKTIETNNIKMQVRSCNDSSCSGKTFVGPDNTTSSWFLNSNSGNLTNISFNRFFQYFAYFWKNESLLISYSPKLYNVSIETNSSDTTAPVINLISPANRTYVYNLTNWFYGSFSDIGGLKNATLYIWNSTGSIVNNSQNQSFSANSGTLNISITLAYDDSYKWNYYACDNSNNCRFNASNFSLGVDTTSPNGTLISPANNSFVNNAMQNLTVNLSDNMGVKNATLNIYNSSNALINQTTTSFGEGVANTVLGTFATLLDGVYKWFYKIFDWAGNSFTTGNFTMAIDTVYPSISFNPSTPENNSGRSGNFIANVSVSELNLANVTWNWNGTINIFNTSCFNFTSSANLTCNITNISSANWIVLFNQSGISSGAGYSYNTSATDSAGNMNSTETRIVLGTVAPTYVWVNQTPPIDSYSNLDPNINVSITANISNIGTFDSAILQWKNSTNGSSWNNITMNNMTAKAAYTIVNASFILPSYEDNITYRIWANNTIGQSSNSSLYIIQSFWDCDWNISSTDLGQSTGWSETKQVGNIIILNSGDIQYANNNCSLQFKLTHNLDASSPSSSRIYFDGNWWKPSDTYVISANSNQTINISGRFLTEVKQESAIININEISLRSSSYEKNSSLILLSNQQGPYLYQSIASYPTSLYLTTGNFSLQGYLRNLMGSSTVNINNTAYNATFYWSLPSGLTNVSGNLIINYTNITDNGLNYNNINASFSSLASMTPGTQTFYLYSYGYNLSGSLIRDAAGNTLLSNAINISFLCYNVSDGVCVTSCGYTQDADCTAPATTTTTTVSSNGGGGGAASTSESIASSADYQLVRGEQDEVKIIFENKDFNESLKDLVFSVKGEIAKYIDIEPKQASYLAPNSKITITLKILSPTYIQLGKQELTIILSAKKGSLSYSDSKKIALEIHELSLETAEELLNKTRELINKLNEENLSSDSLNQLLLQSEEGIKVFNLEQVRDNYQTIETQVQYALDSKKMLGELDSLINSAKEKGIDVSESTRLHKLAQLSIERREFEQAYKRVKDAQLTYALEIKGEFATLGYYLKEYPKEIAMMSFFLIISGFGVYNINRLRVIKKKIKDLKYEEKVLNELIRVVQNECFREKKMSMSEYETAMKEYNRKLSLVIEDLINLETERVQMLRFSGKIKRLKIEKDKIIGLIKELQNDYLKKKKIETRTYELKMESFNNRLSEIEEKLATLEAKQAIRNFKEFRITK